MVAFILPANSATGGYEIGNSLRFNDNDGAYLQRTAGANTGEDNATLSFWFKLGNIKSDNNGGTIMTEGGTSGNHIIQIYAHKIYIGSSAFSIMFPNLIRDPSAWYHLFIAFDSSQGTDTNRVKAYLNGVLLTGATGFTDYPAENENLALCVNGNTTRVGSRGNTGASAFDGYLAEFNFLDGTTKAYTDFGEFNDNGVWIPIKYDGGSYGDNGFYLEFKQTGTSANASGIGADTSGEGHHFSVSTVVATDVTVDTPTNNFCTFNPLDINIGQPPIFSEGNTRFVINSTANSANNHSRTNSTIRPTSGKWYAEFTFLAGYSEADGTLQVGIISGNAGYNSVNNDGYDQDNGNDSQGIGYRDNGTVKNHGTQSLSGLTTFDQDDIMGVALDLDNDKFFVSKNGTFFTNGTGTQDPANGTNPLFSGGVITSHKIHGFNIGAKGYGHPEGGTIAGNYGNPHTAISSGNADGNGYGNFEHAPPSGYFALCTKNLAEYG